MPIGTIFKFLASLWPFLSEMFFAGKTLKQVVMENKFLTVLLFVTCLSITLNYFSISTLAEIALSRREETHDKSVKKVEPKASEVTGDPPAQKETPEEAQRRHEEMLKRLEDLHGGKS